VLKKGLKIILYTILGFLLLATLAVAGIYIFSKPIKNKVVQVISGQLATPVSITDIDLSVFKNFPYVSVSFKNIKATESTKITGEKLMTLEGISVTINPIKLLRGQYQFEEISLKNGTVIAAKTATDNNFSILKTSNDKQTQGSFKLDFKKITLQNIQLQYIDVAASDTIAILVNNMQLKGRFDEKEFLVNTSGNFVPLAIKMGGQKFSITKPVTFQTSFTVNRPDTSYSFAQTKLTIEDFNFIVNGKITTRQKINHINLQLLGDNLRLQQLLQLVPQKYLENLNDYQSDGMMECRVKILGELGKNKTPDINATFKLANGTLSKKGLDVQMRDIQLAGKLNYEKRGDFTQSSLELSPISASVNGEKIRGMFWLANFSNPILKAKVEGTFNLKQWAGFFKLDKIETLEGFATLNLEMEGKTSDFNKKTETLPALFQGTLIAKDVKLKIKGSPYLYAGINGKVYANNNQLTIDTLAGSINGNSLSIKGYARHLLDYMFSTGKILEVEGHLHSPHIDIPSITAINTSNTQTAADTVGITLPKNISFKLKSSIGKLTFNKFMARNMAGTVALGNGIVTLHNLDFDAMGGSFSLTGNVFQKSKEQFVISAELNADKIDISQLFNQCANFGQNQLTADNLQGTLTTRLQLVAPMDRYLKIDVKKLFVTSKITITGGRLYNYEPMLKLSKFIDVSNLQDIAFERLENTIEIKDNRIIIPSMEIKNSALNLLAEGFHSFDNYMEYKFRLRLKDVLAKKFNRRKMAATNYDEDKEGLNIFILMKGTPDNLKIQYDSKSAFKKVKEDIKNEKNTLIDLLRDEFNIKKKDNATPGGNKPKGSNKQDEEIEEWETDIPN
jgi:hypothetical protein